MIPAARVAAVIELLEGVDAALEQDGPAMDMILRRYFAARRYAGSKDRAAISDDLYDLMRHRAELLWALQVVQAGRPGPRLQVIAKLAYRDRQPLDVIETLFSGEGHAPEALTDAEREVIPRLNDLDKTPPEVVVAECPRWLEDSFRRRFGGAFVNELAALMERAPLCLRVNRLRATLEAAEEALAAEGIKTRRAAFAPDALVLEGNPRLDDTALIRDGWVEIQDEGSQVAAMLVGAEPRQQLADLCAGAGGKTLALAAAMDNTGQIYAFDSDGKRLSHLKDRMKRANVRNVQIHRLPHAGAKRDAILAGFADRMDRVVLDVPCSGSGTWRRSPELRWRLHEQRLNELISLQGRLLKEGADLVKVGGRLVYITCSLLMEEGEDRVMTFLSRRADFRLVPYMEVWPEGPGIAPETAAENRDCLLLTPAAHGTDGFFVAVMERVE